MSDDQTTNATGSVPRLVKFFRRTPKARGPCAYCGVLTDNENHFKAGRFFHPKCLDEYLIRKQQDRDRRNQIDVIKQALREFESEKLNNREDRQNG